MAHSVIGVVKSNIVASMSFAEFDVGAVYGLESASVQRAICWTVN